LRFEDPLFGRNFSFTAVAQLVEQRSPKPLVGGSSPSCRATFIKLYTSCAASSWRAWLLAGFPPGIFSQTRNFFAEVKSELQKATWPWDPKERGMKKYRELIDSTTIVIVGMVLLSGFVSLWDLVMMNIVGAFTK
jgi:preprotein translocase subunit SecE